MVNVIRKDNVEARRKEYRSELTDKFLEIVNKSIENDFIKSVKPFFNVELIDRTGWRLVDWEHIKEIIGILEKSGWKAFVVGYVEGTKVTTNDFSVYKKIELDYTSSSEKMCRLRIE